MPCPYKYIEVFICVNPRSSALICGLKTDLLVLSSLFRPQINSARNQS